MLEGLRVNADRSNPTEIVGSARKWAETRCGTCPLCDVSVSKYQVFAGNDFVERCESCGLEGLKPLPTKEQLAAYYDGYATTQTPLELLLPLVDISKDALRHFAKKGGLSNVNGLSFLEVGCGNGASVLAAAELGFDTVALDTDPSSIARLSEVVADQGLSAELRRAYVADLVNEKRTFDVVKVSQVIEHVPDPGEFLHELSQLLKPGGLLILDCPNNDALFWRAKNLLRKRFNRTNFYNSLKLSEHLWGFTVRSLRKALESSGYRVLHCSDYSVRDHIYQPENATWYPSLSHGTRSALRGLHAFPFLKASIGTFDQGASFLGRGMGLWSLAVRA